MSASALMSDFHMLPSTSRASYRGSQGRSPSSHNSACTISSGWVDAISTCATSTSSCLHRGGAHLARGMRRYRPASAQPPANTDAASGALLRAVSTRVSGNVSARSRDRDAGRDRRRAGAEEFDPQVIRRMPLLVPLTGGMVLGAVTLRVLAT